MAFAADVGRLDEPGRRQQSQVPADRRPGDRVLGCEVDHAGGPSDQTAQEIAPEGVGQGREDVHVRKVTNRLRIIKDGSLAG